MDTLIKNHLLLFISFCSCFFSNEILLAQSHTSGSIVFSSENIAMDFIWNGDSINSEWEEKASLLIPVYLDNCPRKFYMQFDTGSPYSMLYNGKIKAIKDKYPKSFSNEILQNQVSDFDLYINKIHISYVQINSKNYGDSTINWNNEQKIEIIGTIGTDFIDGKVVVIDYPNKRIELLQSAPEKFKLQHSFIYSNRNILLPSIINERETLLFFDTGSSMFELLTSKEIAEDLAGPNSKPILFSVNSWGKKMIAHSYPSNQKIEIASRKINVNRATYIEGATYSQVQQMLKMGIGGMTGNKLFSDYILILDTKLKMFGIAIP